MPKPLRILIPVVVFLLSPSGFAFLRQFAGGQPFGRIRKQPQAGVGARSGKGTSLVIPNFLTYPDSVVVEDIKEENYLYTSGYRRACGHETYLWAPFSEDGRSHAYNPLEYIQRRAAYTRVGDVM